MKFKKILLTGATGNLGQAIVKSNILPGLLTPSRQVLDITRPDSIKNFFDKNDIDAIIHCAAMARLKECEENPIDCVNTNIIGTGNLIMETLKKENKTNAKIRFVHISTDGVYEGLGGNYSEKDETIPCNKYGWSKLGSECSVNLLSNFCIIRTRFFDPENIKFEKSATDAYTSKITVNELAKSICLMLNNNFIGTINIGEKKISDFEAYKKYKQSIKSCKFEDILKETNFPLTKDASMNTNLWKKIEQQYKNKNKRQK